MPTQRGQRSLDLLVIGAGTAGQTVARKCAAEGWEVAIVDELPYGGTCALRGCDPKKVLLAAAETLDWQRRLTGHGVRGADSTIDWSELQQYKRSFTGSVPEKVEHSLTRAGVQTLHGTARFRDRKTMEVGGRALQPAHVLIATGAEPMSLGFPGEELLTTSTAFLDLETLPDDITFVGGGFISFELAHVAARAGARVRILEMGERPLDSFDPDLVQGLVAATRELGIEVRVSTRVTALERRGQRVQVRTEDPDGDDVYEASLVVHGAGRAARLAPLELEAGEVDHNKNGVTVDATLRSVSNPRVWGAGDAADAGPKLTPVAAMHGHVVAANLLRGEGRTARHDIIPSVVFAVPPLASVGLTLAEAREQGFVADAQYVETNDWYTSRRINEKHAAHKVIVEQGTGRILGAHLLGHGAEEVINLFAVAMRAGLRAQELKRMTWAYPTKGSDLPFMV